MPNSCSTMSTRSIAARQGAVHAVKDLSLDRQAGRDHGAARLVRLRQDLDLAHDRRLRGRDRTARSRSTARPIHTLPPAQRGVAMAFEAYSLYPPLTIARKHRLRAARPQRLARPTSTSGSKDMAELLEIADMLDQYPSSVSGGQQQRASLGRALVRKAELYLLDEPMGQLEPQLRAVLRGRIKHYLREHQCTTILVTHDQTEANALADRIAVMEGGVLQQYATPAELKDAARQPLRRHLHRRAADECLRRPMSATTARRSLRDRRQRRPEPSLRGSRFRARRCAERLQARAGARARRPAACGAYRRRQAIARRASSPASGSATRPISPPRSRGRTVVSVAHEQIAPSPASEVSPSASPPQELHLFDAGQRRGHRPWGRARMTARYHHRHRCRHLGDQVRRLLGSTGEQLAVAAMPNSYATLPDGGVEQDMARTWKDTAQTLRDLADKIDDLNSRVAAIAVTGPGRRHLADRRGGRACRAGLAVARFARRRRSPRSSPRAPAYARAL